MTEVMSPEPGILQSAPADAQCWLMQTERDVENHSALPRL
jgi:hypothetical protein